MSLIFPPDWARRTRRKSAEEPHAIKRARERYGYELTNEDMADFTAQARRKETIRMARSRDGSETHMAIYKGESIIVVVAENGVIKTVLPRTRPFSGASKRRK